MKLYKLYGFDSLKTKASFETLLFGSQIALIAGQGNIYTFIPLLL
jgi:hypothetical protein